MKIAIVSDSHDNLVNIKKALKYIKENNISTLIHCGDFCAPTTVTRAILPDFNGDIHLVHGNVGDPELTEEITKDIKNIHIYNNFFEKSDKYGFGEIELDNCKIAFTHMPDIAQKLAETEKYNYVFYGHTHKPWVEKFKNQISKIKMTIQNADIKKQSDIQPNSQLTILANPGTLAGMFYRATFAILDTETNKLELIILDTIK